MTVAGTLITMGDVEKPVLFASERLEQAYKDVPGYWKGITFLDCSQNNVLESAEIRNAEISVRLAGSAIDQPDILMFNVSLMHNSVSSLVASDAHVLAVNSLFSHSGFSVVSLTEGGIYDFIHCTMTNRWEYSFRSEPVMFIGKGAGALPEVSVVNTAITGTLNNELFIDAVPSEVTGMFIADSSLIKVDTTGSAWYVSGIFKEVQTSPLPRYIDESAYDYRPDTLSPLLDVAGRSESVTWLRDIRNMPRPTGAGPDIGAYERQPGEKKQAGERN